MRVKFLVLVLATAASVSLGQAADAQSFAAVCVPSILWRNSRWETCVNGAWKPVQAVVQSTEKAGGERIRVSSEDSIKPQTHSRPASKNDLCLEPVNSPGAAGLLQTGSFVMGTGIGQPNVGIGKTTIGIGQTTIGIGQPNMGIGQLAVEIGQPRTFHPRRHR